MYLGWRSNTHSAVTGLWTNKFTTTCHGTNVLVSYPDNDLVWLEDNNNSYLIRYSPPTRARTMLPSRRQQLPRNDGIRSMKGPRSLFLCVDTMKNDFYFGME
jgi:hypothetical protein